jgi:hypothetical protein
MDKTSIKFTNHNNKSLSDLSQVINTFNSKKSNSINLVYIDYPELMPLSIKSKLPPI